MLPALPHTGRERMAHCDIAERDRNDVMFSFNVTS
jgi:hypothetical protein